MIRAAARALVPEGHPPVADFSTTHINTTEYTRRYTDQEVRELIANDLKRRVGLGNISAQSVGITVLDNPATFTKEVHAEAVIVIDHTPTLPFKDAAA